MIFIDANIFIYAAGVESPWQKPCQRFLREVVDDSRMKACTNAEVLQEILHRYTHLQKPQKAFQIFDSVLDLGIPVLSIRAEDLARARFLLEENVSLGSRDAVHLGVMQNHGISKIATYDRGFMKIPWIDVYSL